MRSQHLLLAALAPLALVSSLGCPYECQGFNDCAEDEYCNAQFQCAPLRVRGDPTCSSCVDAGYDYDGGVDRADAGLPTCPEGECCDLDGDGFQHCVGPNAPANPGLDDCDDLKWYVQPNAYEYPTNTVDDNCNGLADAQETPPCTCNPSTAAAADYVHAFDLCDATLVSSADEGDPAQFLVHTGGFFGIPSIRGGCLLAMSSGNATAEAATGASFGGSFPDPDPDPGAPGGSVYDLARVTLQLQVPQNVLGLEFNFMFMSTEWPEFLCLSYNDTFYTIVETNAVNSGAPTNVSFDPNGKPITVNVGFFELPTLWSSALGSTPYGEGIGGDDSCPGSNGECMVPDYCADHPAGALAFTGSGSGWLTTRTPVQPGETMTLTLSIHDEGDGIYDSLVLVDNFRWLPYRPAIGTVKVPPVTGGVPEE